MSVLFTLFLEHLFAPIMGRFDEPNMGSPYQEVSTVWIVASLIIIIIMIIISSVIIIKVMMLMNMIMIMIIRY